MFNRYWRSYPWFFQLLQFIILIVVMASFFIVALTPVVLNLMHVSIDALKDVNEKTPRAVINAFLLIQFLTSIGIFLLPVLLFAYFTHPRPKQYLGLVKPGKSLHWWLAPVIIITATPLFLAIAALIGNIDFGESVKHAQEVNDQTFRALLTMSSASQLLATFFVLAIVPGLSEELFFRGLMMRFAAKRSRTIIFPLVISALLFALMHTNIYGMVSIFLAGLLLGGIYYLTGSLWCSIISHICYNGLQVLLTYFARNNATFKAIDEANTVPVSWVVIGTLLSAASFYLLWKNRTPLKSNWSADYTAEELAGGS
jgi:membrane protease YdiL (CAAX protease family)